MVSQRVEDVMCTTPSKLQFNFSSKLITSPNSDTLGGSRRKNCGFISLSLHVSIY